MPLDLFITRATDRAQLGTTAPLSIADLPPPPDATRMPDGGYRIAHPGGGPWCVVQERGPDIVLSTSYSNPRFLRNFADMFDLALGLATALGANVVEEVGGNLVTGANVNALLAMSGPYVALQADTFRQTQQRIGEEGMAPLEFPLGPVDLVSDYLVFHVGGAQREKVTSALKRAFGARATSASDAAFLVAPPDDRGWLARTFGGAPAPATKVLSRDDGSAQIWPTWGRTFAECAPVTLEVALVLAAELGRPAMLGPTRCDDAFVAQMRPRLGGLGVDFYQWRAES